jgi:hypothetical protein
VVTWAVLWCVQTSDMEKFRRGQAALVSLFVHRHREAWGSLEGTNGRGRGHSEGQGMAAKTGSHTSLSRFGLFFLRLEPRGVPLGNGVAMSTGTRWTRWTCETRLGEAWGIDRHSPQSISARQDWLVN